MDYKAACREAGSVDRLKRLIKHLLCKVCQLDILKGFLPSHQMQAGFEISSFSEVNMPSLTSTACQYNANLLLLLSQCRV